MRVESRTQATDTRSMLADREARLSLIMACMAFIGLGSFTAALGPLVAELAAQTGSTLAAVGAIFTALSLGGLFSQLLAGPVSDRFGQRPVMLSGLTLLSLGLAAITLSHSLTALLIATVVTGLGQGAVDIGGNLLVAVAFARRNTAPLNMLHLFFGLGSVLGPAVVSLSLGLWNTGLPALWLSIALAVLVLPLANRLRPPTIRGGPASPAAAPAAIYRSPLLWVFAALTGVYVGIEIGLGGWTTTYVSLTTGLAIGAAALVTSGYWLSFTAGRVISTALGTRLAPYTILALDLGGMVVASVALILGLGNPWLTIAATALMGLSFGPVFPTMMALLTTTFRHAPGRAASVLAAVCCLSAMVLPWLQGVLLTRYSPATSPWFAAACCAIMLVLYVVARSLHQRSGVAAA